MPESNRRDFLRRAGIGAAALGAAAAAPALIGSATASAAPAAAAPAPVAEAAPADMGGPVVAMLKNAPSGEFLLMVGGKEVTFTDKSLAARMTAALA